MDLIPESWPHQAAPNQAVNQQHHRQQAHSSESSKAYLNSSINPIMPCICFPMDQSSKLHLSLLCSDTAIRVSFPLCGSLFYPLVWGKNVKSLSIQKRESEARFFSQGVELENSTSTQQPWGLRSEQSHGYQEKQSHSDWRELGRTLTSSWFWGSFWPFPHVIALIIQLIADL